MESQAKVTSKTLRSQSVSKARAIWHTVAREVHGMRLAYTGDNTVYVHARSGRLIGTLYSKLDDSTGQPWPVASNGYDVKLLREDIIASLQALRLVRS